MMNSTTHIGDTAPVFSILKASKFIRLCLIARHTIESELANISSPPESLPSQILPVLTESLKLSANELTLYWQACKSEVWESLNKDIQASQAEIETYNKCALQHGTGTSFT